MKIRWLLPLLCLVFIAAAKKQNTDVSVRFHTEANARDTQSFAMPVQLMYPPREAHIRRMPDLTERDVEAIWPFTGADGTMGCAFKLGNNGRIRLNVLSVEYRGSSVVAFVNGRQVIDMQIDKPVEDGIITISRGLSPEEIELFKKKWPIIGQAKTKKR